VIGIYQKRKRNMYPNEFNSLYRTTKIHIGLTLHLALYNPGLPTPEKNEEEE
jgi:hypothetical protein